MVFDGDKVVLVGSTVDNTVVKGVVDVKVVTLDGKSVME